MRSQRIAVFNVEGGYHAADETWSHEGRPLSEGTPDGTVATCSCRGARFDVTAGALGALLSPPARRGVATYPIQVSGPDLVIEIPRPRQDHSRAKLV